jgi:hypothetical protein
MKSIGVSQQESNLCKYICLVSGILYGPEKAHTYNNKLSTSKQKHGHGDDYIREKKVQDATLFFKR